MWSTFDRIRFNLDESGRPLLSELGPNSAELVSTWPVGPTLRPPTLLNTISADVKVSFFSLILGCSKSHWHACVSALLHLFCPLANLSLSRTVRLKSSQLDILGLFWLPLALAHLYLLRGTIQPSLVLVTHLMAVLALRSALFHAVFSPTPSASPLKLRNNSMLNRLMRLVIMLPTGRLLGSAPTDR